MQSSGEDKKIRALFHELKLEDSRTLPSFVETWSNAEAEFKRASFQRRSLKISSLLRVSAAVAVCLVLVAGALLLRHSLLGRQPKHEDVQQVAIAPNARSEAASLPKNAAGVSGITEFHKRSSNPVAGHKFARSNRKNQVASARRRDRESSLSHWQSPTATLMRSASDSLLRVVPQLNESAQEMKKFLANSLN